MPDRDDTFGRFWLNFQRGILFAAQQVPALISPVLKKGRNYYGLISFPYPRTACSTFPHYLATEDGRDHLETQVVSSYEDPARAFLSATSAAGDKCFHDKTHIERRFAGDAADPVCGAAMRQMIEGELTASRLNHGEFWGLKTQARRRGIRFAWSLPFFSFAGGFLAYVGQAAFVNVDVAAETKILLYLAACALPVLGLVAGLISAVMHKGGARAEHEMWTAGIASVSRRNARQIDTDLAGQRAYLQGLIDEVTLHAALCADEVRIDGRRLMSAAEQKAFLGRVARLLTSVLAGHYEYRRICHYLMVYVVEAAESQALCRAFYFNFGPCVRVRKSLLRGLGLGLMTLAAIGGAVEWWSLMRPISEPLAGEWLAIAGPGIGLACCLASIVQAAGMMRTFDSWLRERLPPNLMADLTSSGAPPEDSGPSSGGPSDLSADGHLESRLFEAERIEMVQQLAAEERRRLPEPRQ